MVSNKSFSVIVLQRWLVLNSIAYSAAALLSSIAPSFTPIVNDCIAAFLFACNDAKKDETAAAEVKTDKPAAPVELIMDSNLVNSVKAAFTALGSEAFGTKKSIKWCFFVKIIWFYGVYS